MMQSQRVAKISVGILCLATVILALVPAFQTALKGGYNGIPPSYVGDDLYYYARMKEVSDGKPFIGNPYFIEYRDAPAPAFFVADWIAAIPLLFPVSFSFATTINFIFWSLLFVYLVYLIGRVSGVPVPYSSAMAFLAYREVYWLIFRPVVMQQVFPFFLLFLLALIVWLKNPMRFRSAVFLSIASALPFYIYTYLWQIIVAILGLVLFYELLQKERQEIKQFLRVVAGAFLLASPVIAYTIYQLHIPFYWETMSRIGLVESHFPKLNAYYYGRWTILLAALYIFIWRWLRDGEPAKSVAMNNITLVAFCSGLGLFLVTISNVFTGKELDTAAHIGRFITLWVALFFPILIWKLYSYRHAVWRLHRYRRVILGGMLVLCFSFLASNLTRSLPFDLISKTDSQSLQGFAEPLAWIDAYEEQPVVIWANDDMSVYVPILTKHYVFWRSAGGLHLMPTKEVENRFLASRMKALTVDDLFSFFQDYEGPGPEYRYGDAFYKNRFRCFIGKKCEPDQSMREWIGAEKLASLLRRQQELKKDIVGIMNNYQVAYLIADTKLQEDVYFESIPGVKRVWDNNRFVIYKWK